MPLGDVVRVKRCVAIFVIVTFLVTNHCMFSGYAANPQIIQTSSRLNPSLFENPAQIIVPNRFGKIQESYQGKQKEIVIVIQDAHSIPDAQASIQGMIDYFQKKYGISVVAIEGVSRSLDPQIFKSFPDQKLLKNVLKQYHDQGELAATTAAAIFDKKPALYHGIEDSDLFEQGTGLFLDAMAHEPSLMKKLKVWQKDLEGLKAKVYSTELLKIDRVLDDFYESHSNLPDVLRELARVKEPVKGSELALLYEEMTREGMRDETLEKEVKDLAGQVRKFLEADLSKGKIKKLSAFNEKFQEFQTSKIEPQSFALFLKGLVSEYRMPLNVSQHLAGRMQKQQRMEDIQGTRFFSQFENYAESVRASLIKDENQERINRDSGFVRLLVRLAKLELSQEDWKAVQGLRAKAAGQNQKQNTLDAVPNALILAPDFDAHFAFYENAGKRDTALFGNLEKLLDEYTVSAAGMASGQEKPDHNAPKAAILIAGGFHADGLTRQLKDRNISYLLVVPNIRLIPEQTNYRDQMQGDVSWKSYLTVENGKVSFYKAFVRGARDKLLKAANGENGDKTIVPSPVLKQWRDQIIRDLARQNKVGQAGLYTQFIDEIAKDNLRDELKGKWMDNVERFVQGLRTLESNGKLDERSILELLKTTAIPSAAVQKQVAAGDECLPEILRHAQEVKAFLAEIAATAIETEPGPEVAVSETVPVPAEIRSEARVQKKKAVLPYAKIMHSILVFGGISGAMVYLLMGAFGISFLNAVITLAVLAIAIQIFKGSVSSKPSREIRDDRIDQIVDTVMHGNFFSDEAQYRFVLKGGDEVQISDIGIGLWQVRIGQSQPFIPLNAEDITRIENALWGRGIDVRVDDRSEARTTTDMGRRRMMKAGLATAAAAAVSIPGIVLDQFAGAAESNIFLRPGVYRDFYTDTLNFLLRNRDPVTGLPYNQVVDRQGTGQFEPVKFLKPADIGMMWLSDAMLALDVPSQRRQASARIKLALASYARIVDQYGLRIKTVDAATGETKTVNKKIIPEFMVFDQFGNPVPEKKAYPWDQGRQGYLYSALDSAIAVYALLMLEQIYSGKVDARLKDPGIVESVKAILQGTDFSPMVNSQNKLRMQIAVPEMVVEAREIDSDKLTFVDNKHTEAKILLPLIYQNYLTAGDRMRGWQVWNLMNSDWREIEIGGKTFMLPDGDGVLSAFTQYFGNLFLYPEIDLPNLGKAHKDYLEAGIALANVRGAKLFGAAPAAVTVKGQQVYDQFGLLKPDVVSPVGAVLMLTTGDPRAKSNFQDVTLGAKRHMAFQPKAGLGSVDALNPVDGLPVSRTVSYLNQAMIFLAIMNYANGNRFMARTSAAMPWAGFVEREIKRIDTVQKTMSLLAVPYEINTLSNNPDYPDNSTRFENGIFVVDYHVGPGTDTALKKIADSPNPFSGAYAKVKAQKLPADFRWLRLRVKSKSDSLQKVQIELIFKTSTGEDKKIIPIENPETGKDIFFDVANILQGQGDFLGYNIVIPGVRQNKDGALVPDKGQILIEDLSLISQKAPRSEARLTFSEMIMPGTVDSLIESIDKWKDIVLIRNPADEQGIAVREAGSLSTFDLSDEGINLLNSDDLFNATVLVPISQDDFNRFGKALFEKLFRLSGEGNAFIIIPFGFNLYDLNQIKSIAANQGLTFDVYVSAGEQDNFYQDVQISDSIPAGAVGITGIKEHENYLRDEDQEGTTRFVANFRALSDAGHLARGRTLLYGIGAASAVELLSKEDFPVASAYVNPADPSVLSVDYAGKHMNAGEYSQQVYARFTPAAITTNSSIARSRMMMFLGMLDERTDVILEFDGFDDNWRQDLLRGLGERGRLIPIRGMENLYSFRISSSPRFPRSEARELPVSESELSFLKDGVFGSDQFYRQALELRGDALRIFQNTVIASPIIVKFNQMSLENQKGFIAFLNRYGPDIANQDANLGDLIEEFLSKVLASEGVSDEVLSAARFAREQLFVPSVRSEARSWDYWQIRPLDMEQLKNQLRKFVDERESITVSNRAHEPFNMAVVETEIAMNRRNFDTQFEKLKAWLLGHKAGYPPGVREVGPSKYQLSVLSLTPKSRYYVKIQPTFPPGTVTMVSPEAPRSEARAIRATVKQLPITEWWGGVGGFTLLRRVNEREDELFRIRSLGEIPGIEYMRYDRFGNNAPNSFPSRSRLLSPAEGGDRALLESEPVQEILGVMQGRQTVLIVDFGTQLFQQWMILPNGNAFHMTYDYQDAARRRIMELTQGPQWVMNVTEGRNALDDRSLSQIPAVRRFLAPRPEVPMEARNIRAAMTLAGTINGWLQTGTKIDTCRYVLMSNGPAPLSGQIDLTSKPQGADLGFEIAIGLSDALKLSSADFNHRLRRIPVTLRILDQPDGKTELIIQDDLTSLSEARMPDGQVRRVLAEAAAKAGKVKPKSQAAVMIYSDEDFIDQAQRARDQARLDRALQYKSDKIDIQKAFDDAGIKLDQVRVHISGDETKVRRYKFMADTPKGVRSFELVMGRKGSTFTPYRDEIVNGADFDRVYNALQGFGMRRLFKMRYGNTFEIPRNSRLMVASVKKEEDREIVKLTTRDKTGQKGEIIAGIQLAAGDITLLDKLAGSAGLKRNDQVAVQQFDYENDKYRAAIYAPMQLETPPPPPSTPPAVAGAVPVPAEALEVEAAVDASASLLPDALVGTDGVPQRSSADTFAPSVASEGLPAAVEATATGATQGPVTKGEAPQIKVETLPAAPVATVPMNEEQLAAQIIAIARRIMEGIENPAIISDDAIRTFAKDPATFLNNRRLNFKDQGTRITCLPITGSFLSIPVPEELTMQTGLLNRLRAAMRAILDVEIEARSRIPVLAGEIMAGIDNARQYPDETVTAWAEKPADFIAARNLAWQSSNEGQTTNLRVTLLDATDRDIPVPGELVQRKDFIPDVQARMQTILVAEAIARTVQRFAQTITAGIDQIPDEEILAWNDKPDIFMSARAIQMQSKPGGVDATIAATPVRGERLQIPVSPWLARQDNLLYEIQRRVRLLMQREATVRRQRQQAVEVLPTVVPGQVSPPGAAERSEARLVAVTPPTTVEVPKAVAFELAPKEIKEVLGMIQAEMTEDEARQIKLVIQFQGVEQVQRILAQVVAETFPDRIVDSQVTRQQIQALVDTLPKLLGGITIGFVPLGDENTLRFFNKFLDVLAREASEENKIELIVPGKVRDEISARVRQNPFLSLKPIDDTAKKPAIRNDDQAGVPIVIPGNQMLPVDTMYYPVQADLTQISDDPLAVDYVALLQAVASVHLAVISKERINGRMLTPAEIRERLLHQLNLEGEFQSIVTLNGQNGFVISGFLAKAYLEARAAVRAKASA